MPFCLVPLKKGPSIVLDKAITLIGRNADCDVVLICSKNISRKHCCIAQVGNRFLLRDLGSTNGVWINGERIEAATEMSSGDEVCFGDVPYRMQEQNIPSTVGSQIDPEDEARIGKQDHRESGKLAAKPLNLSQDVPVAIPDEPDSFIVEASINKKRIDLPLSSDAPKSDPGDDNIDLMPLIDD